jgi:hypothetical protein
MELHFFRIFLIEGKTRLVWVGRLKRSLTGSLGNEPACLRSPGRGSGEKKCLICYTHIFPNQRWYHHRNHIFAIKKIIL